MHLFKHIAEMRLLHLAVHSAVSFSSSLFQYCLERKMFHNHCYYVWLFLMHFHEEHMWIWMKLSVIFQLGYSDCILRANHSGYIYFPLKLYSWIIAQYCYFLWALWFHFLDCVGCHAFWYLWYYGGSYLSGLKFYFDWLLNGLVLLLGTDILSILLVFKIIIIFNL